MSESVMRTYDATPRGALTHRLAHVFGMNTVRVVHVLRNGHCHVAGECVTCGAHSPRTSHSWSCPCVDDSGGVAAGWAALEGR